ncbi:hypothetical protein BJ138DRAFT_1117608, partial [Hygrophoropsis aurantiaca]
QNHIKIDTGRTTASVDETNPLPPPAEPATPPADPTALRVDLTALPADVEEPVAVAIGGGELIPPPAPPAPQIWRQMYNEVTYEIPKPGAKAPFYCVTKGTRYGVFVWSAVSPLVTGVSRAASRKVSSVLEGVQVFHEAVRDGAVEIIG